MSMNNETLEKEQYPTVVAEEYFRKLYDGNICSFGKPAKSRTIDFMRLRIVVQCFPHFMITGCGHHKTEFLVTWNPNALTEEDKGEAKIVIVENVHHAVERMFEYVSNFCCQ